MGGVQREGLHWEDLAAMIQKDLEGRLKEAAVKVERLQY